MKKSYIITAALVLLVVLVAVGFFTKDSIVNLIDARKSGTTAPEKININTEDYMDILKGSVDNSEPIIPTDIDGIFYTLKKDGTVSFFQIEGTQIVQIPESGSYSVSVDCTNQNIPATVHYYEKDGKITGYGLFTPENSDADVYIYDYAFFKLMNLPDSYYADNSYLLLVDTTKEDIYSLNKVYEENFRFNTESGSTKNILSNDNRAFDETGAFRADYAMLTEDAVKKCGENLLFFSARQYHLYTKDKNMDLYMAGGSGNNKDNNRYIQNIADFWYSFDKDGNVTVLKRSGESGFNLVSFDGENETVIKEFSGIYEDNFLRSGDWLLNKTDYKMYNLVTGEEKTLKIANANNFIVDIFEIRDKNVFLRGASEGIAAIAVGDIDTGARCYYNPMFSGIFSPIILSDGGVCVSVSSDMQGSSYSVKIFGQKTASEG